MLKLVLIFGRLQKKQILTFISVSLGFIIVDTTTVDAVYALDEYIKSLLNKDSSNEFMLSYLRSRDNHYGRTDSLFHSYLGDLKEQKRINALYKFFQSVSFI